MQLRISPVFVCVSILMCAARSSAADTKLFVDANREELVRAVPELAGLQFDSGQDRLDALLASTGDELAGMLDNLVDLSASEQIHEMRFGDGMTESSRRETDRYVLKLLDNGAPEPFDEVRVDATTGAALPEATGGFLVSSHFEKLLRYLLPEYRRESRFRYLGRVPDSGAWLVAFAQRAGSNRLYSNVGIAKDRTAALQGLVWIDAATHRILRLRTDLAEHVDGFPLETLSTDIVLAPVKFQPGDDVFWLPARVTVHARYAGGELHTVHRYADYHASGSGAAGTPLVAVSSADDGWEMLDRAVTLAHEQKTAEAISLLRETVRLNPEMSEARYHLAATLRSTADAPGAEAELREAVRQSPEFAPAHALLGILLLERGDLAGAAAEMRVRAQLQPKDPAAHFNLAQALEKTDPKAARDEYRAAAALAPDNATIQARLEALEHSLKEPAAPEASGATIHVEVRQVLVPVVVTDKQGHHVTGLTQADFHVFEDGVEQKISGFSVENTSAGAPSAAADPGPAPATGGTPAAVAVPPSKPAAIRRTYLICIDSLNSAFSNLVYVRKALTKLFDSEPSGDARYVLVAVGNSAQVLQAPTTDPAAVLKAIEGKAFQKLFLSSRKSSMDEDLRSFRRDLDDARRACDQEDPACKMLVGALPPHAAQLAAEERMYTVSFLGELRNLVGQLAKETGRRTMVLLSDGFQLVPGKEAFELLDAYFPGTRTSLRTVDRLPDLDSVLRLAANQNIPIYTIDSRGLYTESYFDAANAGGVAKAAPAVLGIMNTAAREAGETLSEVAAATGGTAFRNSNDLFAGLERAFADGRRYYVLAYVPGNANPDGKFRAITVKVGDGKLSVNAKRGYWAVENTGGG